MKESSFKNSFIDSFIHPSIRSVTMCPIFRKKRPMGQGLSSPFSLNGSCTENKQNSLARPVND